MAVRMRNVVEGTIEVEKVSLVSAGSVMAMYRAR